MKVRIASASSRSISRSIRSRAISDLHDGAVTSVVSVAHNPNRPGLICTEVADPFRAVPCDTEMAQRGLAQVVWLAHTRRAVEIRKAKQRASVFARMPLSAKLGE